MIMTGAAGLPSAMTVLVAVRFSPQPSNPAIAASSAAMVSARAAARRADCAASPGDWAKAAGGEAATALTEAGGGAGSTAEAEAAGRSEGRASLSCGSIAIASSAPISTYQRSSASAAAASPGFVKSSADDMKCRLPQRPTPCARRRPGGVALAQHIVPFSANDTKLVVHDVTRRYIWAWGQAQLLHIAGIRWHVARLSGEEMHIARRFTTAGQDPYGRVPFRSAVSEIRNPDGSVVFQAEGIEVPAEWSQVACDILAQKYFRKAGVPALLAPVVEDGVPPWLWRRSADLDALAALPDSQRQCGETSARQVFDRMAGTWTYWGWKGGYFDGEEDAQAFYDEIRLMLARQMGAPNSPQWFNTGLHWAYGIDGPAQGHYYVDYRSGELTVSASAYEHPQPHACFIQSVADDLVNEGGIMDLWVREARKAGPAGRDGHAHCGRRGATGA